MTTAFSIAAFVLGFAAAPAVDAPAGPASRVLPSAAPSALTARTIERLRAKGLRPDDPRLREQLAELARLRRRPASTAKVRLDVTNVKFPPISIFKYVGPLANAPATLPSGMTPVFSGLHPKPTIQQVQSGVDFGAPYLLFTGANLSDGTSYAGTTVSADFGPCGQRTLSVDSGTNPNPHAGTSFSIPGVLLAKDTMTTFWVTVAGVRSDPATFTYPALSLAGSPINTTATLSIADTPPFITGDAGLGLPKTAFVSTTSAARISTNILGTPVAGTDTIGYGINLVNGWTAIALIRNVHSGLDAPSNDGSNDQFRSATVVQQPQSGRLETKIAWTYAPGESISYDVVWQFSNGVLGTRAVTTQQKQTTCSNEE